MIPSNFDDDNFLLFDCKVTDCYHLITIQSFFKKFSLPTDPLLSLYFSPQVTFATIYTFIMTTLEINNVFIDNCIFSYALAEIKLLDSKVFISRCYYACLEVYKDDFANLDV